MTPAQTVLATLTHTFDEWAVCCLAASDYADEYLEAARGESELAAQLCVLGRPWIDDESADSLRRRAQQRYLRALFDCWRDCELDLRVYDALPQQAQVQARRHFFDLDERLHERLRAQVQAEVSAKDERCEPLDAALARVREQLRNERLSEKRICALLARQARLEDKIHGVRSGALV